jgi:hypothetical protein
MGATSMVAPVSEIVKALKAASTLTNRDMSCKQENEPIESSYPTSEARSYIVLAVHRPVATGLGISNSMH